MSAGGYPSALWAAGSISGAGVVVKQKGCVLARTGVGIFTMTLDRDLDAADCVITVTPRGGAGNANSQVAHTSDTVKGITMFVGAVATDVGFDVLAWKIGDVGA